MSLGEAMWMYLQGDKRHWIREGEWEVKFRRNEFDFQYCQDPILAHFEYKIIQNDETLLRMQNYHRMIFLEHGIGIGTLLLKELEEGFSELAYRLGKRVVTDFSPDNQKDTIAWLIKNGYRLEDTLYTKVFDS